MRWLLRAKRWADNPPSAKKVRFVLAIVLICAIIYTIERVFGLPSWMQLERMRRF